MTELLIEVNILIYQSRRCTPTIRLLFSSTSCNLSERDKRYPMGVSNISAFVADETTNLHRISHRLEGNPGIVSVLYAA